MTHVAILGLGLMGGSLGLALKSRHPAVKVHGFTRSKERGQLAIKRGAIDHFYDQPGDAVRTADLVILCAPILSIPEQLISVRDCLKDDAVVTDVGSTKVDVQKECLKILKGRGAVFVGSHPIAGSEQQGMDAARADLYEGAMVVVTPDPGNQANKVQAVKNLWTNAGADVYEMRPEEHDQILALTSHLPHIMAVILAVTVGRPGLRKDIPQFCGTGYEDTTRIAEGGIDIWMDILKTNHRPILQELLVFREKLNQFIEKLEENEFTAIERALNEGKNSRKAFTDYGNQTSSKN